MSRYLNDPETGKPRLLSEQCATCVGRPSNVAGLRPGRLAELVRGNRGGLGLICHETIDYDEGEPPSFGGTQAFCRWFHDRIGSNYQRICQRLGGFTEVPPPRRPAS